MPRPCKKENRAKQHNFIIKRMPSMSKAELLIYYSIISMVMPEDTPDTLFKIDARDYAREMDIDKDASYDIVKKNALSLYHKSLLTETYDQSGKEVAFEAEHMFKKISYRRGEGYVEIKLDDALLDYAKRIKGTGGNFTMLNLESISKLKSANAIRLYELLLMWDGLNRHTLSINEIKRAMYMPHQYQGNASGFVKAVLKSCLEDINTNTELTVKDNHIGRGDDRQVRFTITRKSKHKTTDIEMHNRVTREGKAEERKFWNRLGIKYNDIEYRTLLYLIKGLNVDYLDEYKLQIDYLTNCLNYIEDKYKGPSNSKSKLNERLRQLIKYGPEDFEYFMRFGGGLEDFTDKEISRARGKAEDQMFAIEQSYKKKANKNIPKNNIS